MKKTMKLGKTIYHLEIGWLVASIYKKDKRRKSWRVYLMKSRFTSEGSMNRYIEELESIEKEQENYKKEKKERIKKMTERLKVWDVIVNSWWHEYINADCYQIVEKKWNNVTLRAIDKKLVKVTWLNTWEFLPQKDSFIITNWKYNERTKNIWQFWAEFDQWGSDVWDWRKLYYGSLSSTMVLDKENFRINSFGWETMSVPGYFGNSPDSHRDILIKINPEKDIIEFVSWTHESLVGEQFFTYDAAIRETEKHQKLIPTKKYIHNIISWSLPEWDRIFEYEQWHEYRVKWDKIMDEWNINSTYLRWFWRLFQWGYSFWFVEDFDYWRLLNFQILVLRWDMHYTSDPISYFEGSFEDTRWEMFCSVRCFK